MFEYIDCAPWQTAGCIYTVMLGVCEDQSKYASWKKAENHCSRQESHKEANASGGLVWHCKEQNIDSYFCNNMAICPG